MPSMNRDDIVDAIRDRRAFLSASMSGRAGGGLASDHQLSNADRDGYEADVARREVVYTVYSYATPIAWVLVDGSVRLPEARYSKTTTRQQNIAREALA